MKSQFILFLVFCLLFALMQIPVFHRVFTDVQTEVVMWFVDAEKYRENKALESLSTVSKSAFPGLNSQQLAYLEEVTSSTEKLQKFYQLYCIGDDKNPFIYGTKMHYFCGQISESGLLVVY